MAGTRVCPICGAKLSRYNPDPVCAACIGAVRGGTPGEVPEWLWDSAPLRRALAAANMGAVLMILRAAARLSQLELGVMLGWSQSQVARIESGQRGTLFDVRELLRLADTLDMPRTALAPLLLGTPDATLVDETREDQEEQGMDRRAFATGLLATVGGIGVGLDRAHVPSRVEAAHVRYLQASLDKLIQRDQHVGGATLLRDGLRLYQRARRMLDECEFSEDVGRSLLVASGQLATTAGWLADDAGAHPLARDLYTQALLLAQEADDTLLTIRALDKLTLQSVFLARTDQRPGLAREAVRISGRAAELARHYRTPRLHALLAAREAVAYAAMADDAGFRSSIARAHRELDAGLNLDDPTWLRFVVPAELRAAEAKGRIYLGDPPAAVSLLQESLAENDLSPRNRLNYRAQLAAALARSGETEAAVSEGQAVLPDLEEQVTSPRTVAELRPVRSAAEHIGNDEFCIRWDVAIRKGSQYASA